MKYTQLLLSKLDDQQNILLKIIKESVNISLDKHALLKKIYVRANQSLLWTKNWVKKSSKGHAWERNS